MAVVVGVGIVAIDVIDEVAEYPKEDAKIRSLARRKCSFTVTVTRGEHRTYVQVIAAQLGCSCHWVGTTTNPETDPDAAYAHAELERLGVDCSTSTVLPRGSMPVSFILASRATGSRTIVHSRDLQELRVSEFEVATRRLLTAAAAAVALEPRLWFHFEGRNMDAVLEMMRLIRAQSRDARISVEVEALRYDWKLAKQLVATADFAFLSKDYIRDNLGFQDADAFLIAEFGGAAKEGESLRAVICPWGSDGVFYWRRSEPQRGVQRIATKSLDRVVESIGAGDTFIGACVAALSNVAPLEQALQLACEVATEKCSRIGFELGVEERERWSKFVTTAKLGDAADRL